MDREQIQQAKQTVRGTRRRPLGVIWEHLSPDAIAAIPALAHRKPI